ncbi:hypothetical protein [Cyclobacterium plantarum]|uniref:Uncharacterized protein n=1 Tax=Cyclobacterium plantarum TaxID=2716263 RepID=A0ABX0HF73_9BACT|nr:hypothetical protein [Cyclobacterium plantarum]NHE58984.1 hypothetical protein [Cyclobacterium plantarum]
MVFASLLCVSEFTFAQERSAEEAVGSGDAVTSRTRGDDPNIEQGKAPNVKGELSEDIVQPADKGGRTRGTICYVNFDNWTSWIIDCYVDGRYKGDVAAYGEGGVTVGAGDTRVYAVAEFTDGSKVSYGPVTKYCSNAVFNFEMHSDSYKYAIER